MSDKHEISADGAERRSFLAAAGRFAIVVPPAMTVLLATTMSSPAIAASGDIHGEDALPLLGLIPLGLGHGAPAAAAPLLVAEAPAPAAAPLVAAAPAPAGQSAVAGSPLPAPRRYVGTPVERAGERG
jgi:hypothetical protein